MKHSLRISILVAFTVFIALTLGASRLAHVFSNKALLEEELGYAREDLKAVSAHLEEKIAAGDEAEGIAFFEDSYKVESIGYWDCCYALCDSTGQVVSPSAIAILTIHL